MYIVPHSSLCIGKSFSMEANTLFGRNCWKAWCRGKKPFLPHVRNVYNKNILFIVATDSFVAASSIQSASPPKGSAWSALVTLPLIFSQVSWLFWGSHKWLWSQETGIWDQFTKLFEERLTFFHSHHKGEWLETKHVMEFLLYSSQKGIVFYKLSSALFCLCFISLARIHKSN